MNVLPYSLILLLCLPGAADAEAGWTFQQILQAATVSHPQVLARRSTLLAAQAEKNSADWQRFPSPSLEAHAFNGGGNTSLLRLDQPLWTGGRITAGIESAAGRLGAAEAGVEETRLDMLLRVIAASAEAVRQQKRLGFNQASVEAHERLLAMMRRRVQQEVSPLADQRLAESRLHAEINEASATATALENALAQLSQLCGEAVPAFEAASFERLADTGLGYADLSSLLDRVLSHSPSLVRLRHESEVAQADVAASRSVYQPKLSFRLEGGTGTNSDNRAMIVFSAQPGAGLSARSGVEAALARRDASLRAADSVERQLRETTTLAWNEWRAALGRRSHLEQARTLAQEVSESYSRQFVTGRKSWLDVLNAAREATQAELAVVDVGIQIRANALRLRALAGDPALIGQP